MGAGAAEGAPAPAAGPRRGRRARKARKTAGGVAWPDPQEGRRRLLEAAAPARRILVFSGSGMSAASGMSLFSKQGGLYDKARKRHKLKKGVQLFTYSFFESNRAECCAFLAELCLESLRARPTATHRAIGRLAAQGRLLRHYSEYKCMRPRREGRRTDRRKALNVDRLMGAVAGAGPVWDADLRPGGTTVELHGNCQEVVCPNCTWREPLDREKARSFLPTKGGAGPGVACPACFGPMRPKVLLYGDGDAAAITPDEVFDVLDKDTETADLVLW